MSASRGVTVKDVSSSDFIMHYAAQLKRAGKVQLPEWVDVVKTGIHKELAPYDPDWYFVRAAAIARRVYLRGGSGVGAYRKVFGGPIKKSTAPSHFVKGSGSVIRHALQELEKAGIVQMHPKGGRRVTKEGQRDLDRIAGAIVGAKE